MPELLGLPGGAPPAPLADGVRPFRIPFSLRAEGGRLLCALPELPGRGVGVLGRPLTPGRGVGDLRVGLRPAGPAM